MSDREFHICENCGTKVSDVIDDDDAARSWRHSKDQCIAVLRAKLDAAERSDRGSAYRVITETDARCSTCGGECILLRGDGLASFYICRTDPTHVGHVGVGPVPIA